MSQDATEQSLERRLIANEIRVSGSERLNDVIQARNYLLAQATEAPKPVVSIVEQAAKPEVKPPVAQHIVGNTSEVAPVAETAEPVAETQAAIDPTDVDAIRERVAVLSDTATAQNARDEYGIFS